MNPASSEAPPNPERRDHTTMEQEAINTPRIYVADLAAYNNGVLWGAWIDATDDLDTIWQRISEMLARSPVAGGEEIAIHDYDNYASVQLGEYTPIDTAARVARGIVEHGDAYAVWVNYCGLDNPDDLDAFEDHYLGSYESLTELGEELAGADELDRLVETHLPEFIGPYVRIDFEGFGADVASGCHSATGADGRLHLFDP